MTAKRYRHDCEACRFLGSYLVPIESFTDDPDRTADLYFCPGSLGGTVIARFSDQDSDYQSMPLTVLIYAHLGMYSPLVEAARRQIYQWDADDKRPRECIGCGQVFTMTEPELKAHDGACVGANARR